MCTPIDFKYLVICTGYESRLISDQKYMELVKDEDYPKISNVIIEGKVEYGEPTPISDFIINQKLVRYYKSSVIYKEDDDCMSLWIFFHQVYQSGSHGTGDSYCRSYGISSMMYNNELKALFIHLDSESG